MQLVIQTLFILEPFGSVSTGVGDGEAESMGEVGLVNIAGSDIVLAMAHPIEIGFSGLFRSE